MRLPTAETISWLEVGWTAAAALGLLFAAWMLADARGDQRALRRARLNGARLIVARQAVRWEWIRVGTQALLLLVGVSAMFRPNQELTTPQVIYTLLALYLPLGSTVGSILSRRDRIRLLAYLSRVDAARRVGN